MGQQDRLLKKNLQEIFGLNDYQSDNQKEVVKDIFVRNRKVKKSIEMDYNSVPLCYQLPAVVKRKSMTLVVSSTIHYAKDQVEYLENRKIVSFLWHNGTPERIKAFITNDLKCDSPKMKILYVTLDIFSSPQFQGRLLEIKPHIDLNIIVNLVNCSNIQNVCFTIAFKKLNKLKKKLPSTLVVAMINSKTELVRNLLKLDQELIFSPLASRSNLSLNKHKTKTNRIIKKRNNHSESDADNLLKRLQSMLYHPSD